MLKIASCNCTSDLEIAVAMALSIEKSADTEVWGVSFLQADEILGYLAEEAISRVELFCCMTMDARILPGWQKHELFHWDIFKHPPYSPDLAPSSFYLFPKKWSILLVNASIDEDLNDAGWITRRPHGMKRVYTNWYQGTTRALMSKATMRKSWQRYIPELVYSVSVLWKNILVWQNVVYFMDGPRK